MVQIMLDLQMLVAQVYRHASMRMVARQEHKIVVIHWIHMCRGALPQTQQNQV